MRGIIGDIARRRKEIAMTIIWHAFPGRDFLIAGNIDTCRACYYPEQRILVLEENGKVFDDHAYAKFEDVSQKEADLILLKLAELRTV